MNYFKLCIKKNKLLVIHLLCNLNCIYDCRAIINKKSDIFGIFELEMFIAKLYKTFYTIHFQSHYLEILN